MCDKVKEEPRAIELCSKHQYLTFFRCSSMRLFIFYSSVFVLLLSCAPKQSQQDHSRVAAAVEITTKEEPWKIYTETSPTENRYQNFNSNKAVNKIAEIENQHFNAIRKGASQYYGTVWKKNSKLIMEADSTSAFENYLSLFNSRIEEPDSMHCTIYATHALKAGLGDEFDVLDQHHKRIWKDREYAGWSVGHILCKEFGWKAYLMVSQKSKEYQSCIDNFKKDKHYHVWRQPNIPIERLYDFDDEKAAIDSLLSKHEFGWGFSDQGWHTWITRFGDLKECNWAGSPYGTSLNEKPLFLKTKFTEFYDYDSHIVVFPPIRN